MLFEQATGVSESEAKEGSLIMSSTFQHKVLNKMKVIKSIQGMGFNLLYMDCDIILFRDPWPILYSFYAKGFDIVSQKDYTLNSGFMLLFPTANTKAVLRRAYYHMLQRSELDQESIQFAMKTIPCSLHLLPERQFSNGRVFFSHHQFYWDTIGEEEVMMHNNFIIYSVNKYYRLREMHLYDDDSDGYYSSPTKKYVMVDAEETRRNTTRYLMQVAVLSRLLNRTFLLPTFLCPTFFTVKKCNLCRNELMCFKKFRDAIHGNYRAYVLFCLFHHA